MRADRELQPGTRILSCVSLSLLHISWKNLLSSHAMKLSTQPTDMHLPFLLVSVERMGSRDHLTLQLKQQNVLEPTSASLSLLRFSLSRIYYYFSLQCLCISKMKKTHNMAGAWFALFVSPSKCPFIYILCSSIMDCNKSKWGSKKKNLPTLRNGQ